MMFLKTLAVLLHILTAAGFFGLGLLLPRQARVFAGSRDPLLGESGERTARMMTMFAVLTLFFGLVAFFIPPGGFGTYGPEYHTSLLLILVLIGVHVGIVQRGWSDLRTAVAGGTDAEASLKRVSMGVGIAHLIWVILLVLMFWSAPLFWRFGQFFG